MTDYPVVDWTKLPVPKPGDLDALKAYNDAVMQFVKLGPMTEIQQIATDQIKAKYHRQRREARNDSV